MQQNTVYLICQLLQIFRVVFHQSSGAHSTVSTASGINETCCELCQPRSHQVPIQVSLISDTVHTVLCAPDDE